MDISVDIEGDRIKIESKDFSSKVKPNVFDRVIIKSTGTGIHTDKKLCSSELQLVLTSKLFLQFEHQIVGLGKILYDEKGNIVEKNMKL